MNPTLLFFFFRRLLAQENRNGASILGAFGLFFSSAALLVLLTIMGGLQEKMKWRSQNLFGLESLLFSPPLIETLAAPLPMATGSLREWEEEMMLRHENGLSAVIVHGIDLQSSDRRVLPVHGEFLQDGVIIGRDLSLELDIDVGDTVHFFSPRYLDLVFGETPRLLSAKVSMVKDFTVPEADRFHVWMRLQALQNLTRQHGINRQRFFVTGDLKKSPFLALNNAQHLTWTKENQTLESSLQLESRVMLFLFCLMTLLVGVAQFAGLLLIGQQLRPQLLGLWIMGENVKKLALHLIPVLMTVFVAMIACGLLFGAGVALGLQYFSPYFMPDIFVEKGLPLQWAWSSVAISAGIPFLLNITICFFYYRYLLVEWNFLRIIRVQQS